MPYWSWVLYLVNACFSMCKTNLFSAVWHFPVYSLEFIKFKHIWSIKLFSLFFLPIVYSVWYCFTFAQRNLCCSWKQVHHSWRLDASSKHYFHQKELNLHGLFGSIALNCSPPSLIIFSKFGVVSNKIPPKKVIFQCTIGPNALTFPLFAWQNCNAHSLMIYSIEFTIW